MAETESLGGGRAARVSSKRAVKSRGIKFIAPSEETAEGVIRDLEHIHGRTKFYVLVSGGKDSMSVCHWLAERNQLEAAVHIQTNVGIRRTTEFVREYCGDMGWKIYVLQPRPKFVYAAFVLQYGFPGPGAHKMIMGLLKYQTMRDFALSHDPKHHCLISGVRKFESDRRRANYPHPIQHDGRMWFGCPFFYHSTQDVYRYVHEHGVKITPVHDTMGMSGECMCGSFTTRGEKEMIRQLDPQLAAYISWLEEGVRRFGTMDAKARSTWGGTASMDDLARQRIMDAFFEERPDLRDVNEMQYGICGEECGMGTMRGMTDY